MPDSQMPPFERTTAFLPSVRQPPAREWSARLGQLWNTAQQGLGLVPVPGRHPHLGSWPRKHPVQGIMRGPLGKGEN